jgi:hypothetical protein
MIYQKWLQPLKKFSQHHEGANLAEVALHERFAKGLPITDRTSWTPNR